MRDFLGKHDIRLVNTFPALIGLTGAAGAGKSTVAEYMRTAAGYDRMSFADPIKDALVAMGVPEENLRGTPDEKSEPRIELCGRTARYAMRTLGTEWGQDKIGRNIWVNMWRLRYMSVAGRDRSFHRFIVVDDVRFASELDIIRGYGGLIVEVAGVVPRTEEHRSETKIDRDVDFVWHNQRHDRNQLMYEFHRLMERIRSRPVKGNWWSLERSNAYKESFISEAPEWKV